MGHVDDVLSGSIGPGRCLRKKASTLASNSLWRRRDRSPAHPRPTHVLSSWYSVILHHAHLADAFCRPSLRCNGFGATGVSAYVEAGGTSPQSVIGETPDLATSLQALPGADTSTTVYGTQVSANERRTPCPDR